MIEVRHICKSYGNLAVLKDVSLTVGQSEIVSVVGQSGAGKTTLLQIMGSLEKADSGTVTIGGEDIGKMNEREISAFRNRNIGFIFQFHQLLPEFTALENAMMPALIAHRNYAEAQKKAVEILDFLNLGHRLQHKPSELSGGEKQRVAVARALINNPSVIFADEPSGSLDSRNKEELHKLFFDLREKFKQTIVIVTHDKHLASISDRIIEMQDGKICAE